MGNCEEAAMGRGAKTGGGALPAFFAGTGPTGKFFETPHEWVDPKRAPGTTPQPVNVNWLKGYWTFAFAFYSPNLVWFAAAALDYLIFPYDIASTADLSSPLFRDFLIHRFAVNTLFTISYFGFWHVSLYHWGWGQRKFNPNGFPANARLLHNIWYLMLGVAQWTVWEGCIIHLFASGKMPHISDHDAFSTVSGAARLVAGFFLVPLFRDLHFYFAHRMLHIRCLYKYVHSLHHRNTDIEPFAGLCMHPIEHLYYFACVAPLLYTLGSPFATMWMGMHLLLSPAASHSGWEDHMQSDQYHYLHHAKFECNYGTPGIPFDSWFGTFREKLGKSEMYKGEATDSDLAVSNPDAPVKKAITKDNFKFPAAPKFANAAYFTATATIFGVFLAALLEWSPRGVGDSIRSVTMFDGRLRAPQMVAALVAVGPVVAGLVGCVVSKDRFSLRWPFHKDSVFGGFGFHVSVGFVFCVMPVYHTIEAVLGAHGESAYCKLWGGCAGVGSPSG